MADSFFDKIYRDKTQHTPDVLSCLANLSNDEVFTPPDVVNKMLNLLPQELFCDPNTTFLDPACKTGVFLREIAKRLLVGLEDKIPDLQQRIDHIFHKQLFGIAITELTSLLSRRSLYCSKYPNGPYSITHFDDAEGNIRYRRINHTWVNGKCKYCGASKEQWQRDKELETHAYELIHSSNPEGIFNMKFDVIISNPPYHLTDSGNGTSAKPIYNLFVEQSKKLAPRFLIMIIPSRWFAGGKGLESFRHSMLSDKHIRKLVDFENYKDVFPGLGGLAGGACYFVWDRDNPGLCEVVNKTSKEFGFTIVDGIDWNDLNSRKYCIDTEALNDYLAKSNPEWSKSGIRNDVHSITQINIERNGSYDIKFGGKSRLPIFITSNNKLIHDIKEYTVKCSNDGIPLPWHTNKLPLISDYDLTCRLWLTSKHQEPVSLNLIKSAYLYQQSDNEFYKKILETYQQVKEKHKYNVIDLDYIRFEKLKELIIIDTKGDIESINDDVVATSFEELATRQSLAKDKTIEDLNKQRNAKDIKINQITDSFIKSVSDRYKEKISIFQRLISFGISNLHWIISALGIILVFVFGQLQNEKILSQYNLLAILPIVISIVFEFLDKKVFTESILLKWQNRYKSICKGRFESMIISTLREEELPYKERIIMCSIDNTRFFNTDGKT